MHHSSSTLVEGRLTLTLISIHDEKGDALGALKYFTLCTSSPDLRVVEKTIIKV